MTLLRPIILVLLATIVFTALGSGIGLALGQFVPGYYRSVFRDGQLPTFDPVGVGVGLGATQGAIGGAVIGVLLVALGYWRDRRAAASVSTSAAPTPPRARSSRVLLLSGMAALVVVCCVASWIIGTLVGYRGETHRRYLEEHRLLAPAIRADPAFAAIVVAEDSRGGVVLYGTVPTPADEARLSEVVARAVGAPRGQRLLEGVRVPQPPPAINAP